MISQTNFLVVIRTPIGESTKAGLKHFYGRKSGFNIQFIGPGFDDDLLDLFNKNNHNVFDSDLFHYNFPEQAQREYIDGMNLYIHTNLSEHDFEFLTALLDRAPEPITIVINGLVPISLIPALRRHKLIYKKNVLCMKVPVPPKEEYEINYKLVPFSLD